MGDKKILICGFGSAGRRHFRNLYSLGIRDFVFLRTHKGSISDEEVADYPSFDSIEGALSQKPDIVFVTNPSSLHVDVALKAANAACDIFIEKPLSSSLVNCAKLDDLISERGLVCMVASQFRFHPQLCLLRDLVKARSFGSISKVKAYWGEYLPSWHPWEDYRSGYSAREDLGGGVIFTLIHPFDYLYWIFGSAEVLSSNVKKINKNSN